MTEAKRNKRVKPDPELLKLADALLANYQKPEDLIGENGLLKQLTKMLIERALETEMTEHLGHGKSGAVTNHTGNTRNGHSAKTLQGDFGELPLDIPRDRQGHSSRNWLPGTRPAGLVLTPRSSPCTPAA
jgi:putative transposase